jgi:hypothetical protein
MNRIATTHHASQSATIVKAALALIAALACQLASPSAASADQLVVPGMLASIEGDGNNNNPLTNVGATAQLLISSSQLAAIPAGSPITGIRFRLNAGLSSAPTVAATWTDYEITLAQLATSIASPSAVFANNMTSPVLVRDGALTLAANSFPSGNTPNNFGPLVAFNQSSYTYQGGGLVLLLSHNESNLSGTIAVDSATSATPAYGTDFRAIQSANFQALAATNTSSSFPVLQFEFTPVPEPASGALLALGAIGGLRRRRRLGLTLVNFGSEHRQ